MKTKKLLLLIATVSCLSLYSFSQNNVTITDESSHNAHESAVLDVYSTSKGMLVPRLTTEEIGLIGEPATGLLVYNSDTNSFHYFNGLIWINLSTTIESIWSVNPITGDIFLDNPLSNLGIGTNEPGGKLAVAANSGAVPDEPLFEITDEFGYPIFSVTSEGVRVYVKESDGKAVSGGFAVGRYGAAKGLPDTTFLLVTPDSTRIYVNETQKAVSGGFAVGRYGSAKANTNFLHFAGDNYLIGEGAGSDLLEGRYNVFFGYHAGISTYGGNNNLCIGNFAGRDNQNGSNNIYIGENSGAANSGGSNNTFLGYQSGENSTGSDNIFIGFSAGNSITESDKLIISNRNSTADSPLLWGDFALQNLVINGTSADNTESSTFFVNGSASGLTSWNVKSDIRLKTKISTISNSLDKVMNIRGVNFEWIDKDKFSEGKKMGFIAQEINEVIPEVVNISNGSYSMQYAPLTALLVEAVKEQQTMINELKSENYQLKKEIQDIKNLLEKK